MSEPRTEEVLVLYGSQTGNSEQAAIEICDKIPEQLSPSKLAEYAGGGKAAGRPVAVTARHMQLDDFLELERAKWTRLVVIVTSSYGVGQAPIGCYRFREMCDAIVERNEGDCSDATTKMLDGVTFALLGLGDSHYTTFFRNPTRLDEALRLAGAKRAGPIGKADASGKGEDAQGEVIERWIASIWPVIAGVVSSDPPSEEILALARSKTLEFCVDIFPDFAPPSKGVGGIVIMVLAPIVLALIAMAILNGFFTPW